MRGGPSRDALEGKGPQRQPQKRVDRQLEEVAKRLEAVTVPYKCHGMALAVRETVAGRRLGAGGGGAPPLPMYPGGPRKGNGTGIDQMLLHCRVGIQATRSGHLPTTLCDVCEGPGASPMTWLCDAWGKRWGVENPLQCGQPHAEKTRWRRRHGTAQWQASALAAAAGASEKWQPMRLLEGRKSPARAPPCWIFRDTNGHATRKDRRPPILWVAFGPAPIARHHGSRKTGSCGR